MNRLSQDGRSSTDEEEILAALALALAPGLPPRDKVIFVKRSGSCRQALTHVPDGRTSSVRRRAEKEWQECRRRGYSVLSLASPCYPALLKEIAVPPLALYVWGELDQEDRLALAIVGSRRATPYGLEACSRLSRDLALRGATVVSGLARGIDARAHQAALEVNGRTLAVLGSGLDVLYPREHKELAGRIARTAAVISEFPLGTPPLPGHFPQRNRIVSGLALGTIVIQAEERSGSLISARLAAEENREVFAVPGPVGSPNSGGVHRLIQNGAKLVTDALDVIEELRPDVQERLRRSCLEREEPGDASTADETLAPDEKAVLEALYRNGTLDAERLVNMIGLPPDRVGAALVGLEIQGRVRSFGGGFYRSSSDS